MNVALNTKYSIGSVLFMVLELADKKWELVFSNGQRNRHVKVEACQTKQVLLEIDNAKRKLSLPADCAVLSCYEAGWEGFWLARWLESEGIDNQVLDSSSIEVKRRAKHVKTDKVDGDKMMLMLQRYNAGEKKVFSIVRVPSENAEDERRLHRERKRLVKERGGHKTRINSLIRGQGIRMPIRRRSFLKDLEQLRLWNDRPLPPELMEEIKRQWQRYLLSDTQIKQLEKSQREQLEEPQSDAVKQVAQLMRLRCLGMQSSWTLVMELFAWRHFKNRKHLASLVGLTPMPYQSGDNAQEQGISKSGNPQLRSALIELSWFWLRYQPQSQLSHWFQERFGNNGKRMRRVGIVALARKLLIALWRYLQYGEIPEGAVLKPVV